MLALGHGQHSADARKPRIFFCQGKLIVSCGLESHFSSGITQLQNQRVGSSDLSAIWERRKQPAPKGFLSLSQRENLQAC